MSWGNDAPIATPVAAIMCDHPDCKDKASLVIEMVRSDDTVKADSCIAHADGMTIVDSLPGATIDEGIIKRLIAQHDEAKAVLERAKNSEMAARLLLGNYAFPVQGRKEGVNNMELGDGRMVKLGHKVNYTLEGDNEAIEKVEEACDKIGNEGSFLIERIITWEAKFSKSEYNKLQADNPTHMLVKAEVDKVLKTSNGTPSLEVKEPKATLNG